MFAIRANAGVFGVACGMAGLATAWTMMWILAVMGSRSKQTICDGGGDDDDGIGGICKVDWNGKNVSFLAVSLYWTLQVFRKAVCVTASGVVGTWLFVVSSSETRAGACWSHSIIDSLVRSTTYSLGSICLGSLCEAILHATTSLLVVVLWPFGGLGRGGLRAGWLVGSWTGASAGLCWACAAIAAWSWVNFSLRAANSS